MPRHRADATPWYHRILEVIEDGEWHDVSDIVSLVAPMIPPGMAWRRAEHNRERSYKERGEDVKPRKFGNQLTTIQTGQRQLVIVALNTMKRVGRIEVEYKDVSNTPGKKRLRPQRVRKIEHTMKAPGTRPILDNVEHGTNSAYTQGCGCDPCRLAHREYHRLYEKRHKRVRTRKKKTDNK